MSNSLDPDQARRYVGPDLGPKCLQNFQQTTLEGSVKYQNLVCADSFIIW